MFGHSPGRRGHAADDLGKADHAEWPSCTVSASAVGSASTFAPI
jgi:hypothetical protein